MCHVYKKANVTLNNLKINSYTTWRSLWYSELVLSGTCGYLFSFVCLSHWKSWCLNPIGEDKNFSMHECSEVRADENFLNFHTRQSGTRVLVHMAFSPDGKNYFLA